MLGVSLCEGRTYCMCGCACSWMRVFMHTGHHLHISTKCTSRHTHTPTPPCLHCKHTQLTKSPAFLPCWQPGLAGLGPLAPIINPQTGISLVGQGASQLEHTSIRQQDPHTGPSVNTLGPRPTRQALLLTAGQGTAPCHLSWLRSPRGLWRADLKSVVTV